MSKPKAKSVNMDVPPEERRRPRKNRMGGTPPAQMAHAGGSRAGRQRRDGERWLAAERPAAGEPDEVPYEDCLIGDESEMQNLLMARRSLGQDW